MAFAAPQPSGNWSKLLLNKVVFITGAGGGIGSAIAKTCFLHGARVVIADVRKEAAENVRTTILEENPQGKDSIFPVELDVTDEKQIENVVGKVVEMWKTIDVLVNKSNLDENIETD